MTPLPAQDIKRILVTRLRFLGDVVLSTPLIRALHQTFPKAHLTYLAEKPYGEVLENNPNLNEIIALDRKKLAALPINQRAFAHAGFIKKLREKKFDLVIDLLGNPRSGLLSLFTGAVYRIGPYRRGRAAYYSELITEPERVHNQIEALLAFLKPLGIDPSKAGQKTEVFVSDHEKDEAKSFLKENHLTSKPLVILHPGASWPAKRWLPERFAQTAERLKKDLGASVLLLGGPEEDAIVGGVVQHMKEKPPVAEAPSVRKLCALLLWCDLLLTNDGGPMHIACALGKPTLALFGPGDPGTWFPYKPEDRQIAIHHPPECWPCHLDECIERDKECMKAISVDEVVKKAKHLLAQPASTREQRLSPHPALSHEGRGEELHA